ncbi:AMP-binding protein [uncultured Polaribacter sp.]|uniref:AMP-binding protein n=1 Tax=uncultured Polaribacter sp. TaxID=174711 RepID=UPI00262F4CD9|nr:AMP-binding protein [uncultured Polaribacter sp.]
MEKPKFHKNFTLNGFSFTNTDEIVQYVQSFSAETHVFLKDWFSNTAFIVVQTSGSTGKPKPIKLLKSKMINSAFATGKFFNLKPKTTALLCLPVQYIAGKMMLIRAITLGWHLDIVASNANPLATLNKVYDFSAMVPLQVENAVDKLHLIKKLIVGGGVVSNKLQEKLQNISTQVFATYGMTESITHIAVKKLNHAEGFRLKKNQKTYYTTLPNTTIYVDERNCLVIKNEKVTNEIVFTNDVVSLISDTQFEWLGRFDNVINSGGVKLHPEKIEEKLSKIIEQHFFVTGISDEVLGEKLILIVEKGISSNLDVNFLSAKIKALKTLSKFEIPKEMYFTESFVETETGKIQRKKTLQHLQTSSKS